MTSFASMPKGMLSERLVLSNGEIGAFSASEVPVGAANTGLSGTFSTSSANITPRDVHIRANATLALERQVQGESPMGSEPSTISMRGRYKGLLTSGGSQVDIAAERHLMESWYGYSPIDARNTLGVTNTAHKDSASWWLSREVSKDTSGAAYGVDTGNATINLLCVDQLGDLFSHNHYPFPGGNRDLGSATHQWDDVFCTAVTASSDARVKENVQELSDGLQICEALRPVKYTFIPGKGKSGRIHTGLIAQEVAAAMPAWGGATTVPAEKEGEDPEIRSQWGLFVSEKEAGKTAYGLRYTELVAVLISAVKTLSQRVKALEGGGGAAAVPSSKRKRTA